MRIDVLGLEAFVTIAERGSFHAAASHLNLSQTALSHRIRKLEESLSIPLLLRTTRQVSLTAAGVELLPRARDFFDGLGSTLDTLRRDVAREGQRVALACLPTIAMQCLPRALAEFTRERPDVIVKVHDNSASEIANKVQSGEAEFGVTIVAANRWDLQLKPVVKEPFVLVCHRSLPRADAPSLTWADLHGLPLVRVSAETGNRVLIDDALGSRGALRSAAGDHGGQSRGIGRRLRHCPATRLRCGEVERPRGDPAALAHGVANARHRHPQGRRAFAARPASAEAGGGLAQGELRGRPASTFLKLIQETRHSYHLIAQSLRLILPPDQ